MQFDAQYTKSGHLGDLQVFGALQALQAIEQAGHRCYIACSHHQLLRRLPSHLRRLLPIEQRLVEWRMAQSLGYCQCNRTGSKLSDTDTLLCHRCARLLLCHTHPRGWF